MSGYDFNDFKMPFEQFPLSGVGIGNGEKKALLNVVRVLSWCKDR